LGLILQIYVEHCKIYMSTTDPDMLPHNVKMFVNKFNANCEMSYFVESEPTNPTLPYIRHAASIYFGLSPGDARKLAYECALLYEIQIPGSLNENKGQVGTGTVPL
jgi:hypothetical protein